MENYQHLFTRTDFLENTLNSFYVAGGSTVLGLLLALPAAYAISWHRMTWPATLTLFARMAPGTLFLLPWFIMFSNLGLSGTHAALIITHAVITLPIALWTMLPHFDGLPRELTESAQIDGCSSLKILILIALPIVMPGLIVAIILSFIFSWNYFLLLWLFQELVQRLQLLLRLILLERALPIGEHSWRLQQLLHFLQSS